MRKIEAQIRRAIRAGTPVLLWGPPGVGKSALIQALGKSLGLPVVTLIASIREPSDFAGLPVLREDGVRLEPPAWARYLKREGKGFLFLDEISTAPPAVQAALLRVVLERVVGELPLPPEVAIVAAANPPDQAAGGWDLSPPLANRFLHLHYTLDPMEWAEEFATYWGSPPVLSGVAPGAWERARVLVASFIRARPHLLLRVPKEVERQGKAWPSPRSWDHGSRALAAVIEEGAPLEEALPLLAGAVGEGEALEFLAWAREADLPDPEEILAHPELFRLPARGDLQYAVLSAVVTAALRGVDLENPRPSKEARERIAAAWRVMEVAVREVKDVAAAAAKPLAVVTQRAGLPYPREVLQALKPVLL